MSLTGTIVIFTFNLHRQNDFKGAGTLIEREKPAKMPQLLGHVKLSSAVPELFYLCRLASTTRRKHLPGMKTES